MRKIKEAVNLILVFCVGSVSLWGAEHGHVLALRDAGVIHILHQSNTKLASPVGSLLKPFAAWYLLEQGLNAAQTVFCPNSKRREGNLRCWTDAGHGEMSVQTSLAQSCNYFYLSQFRGRDLKAYQSWLRQRFDWPESLLISKPEHVYGFDLTGGLEATKILEMYNKLLNSADNPHSHAASITMGLRGVCEGTLADFCRSLKRRPHYAFILGKTGTVLQGRKNFGAALLYVEHIPTKKKLLLLCYEKNKMGSEVAIRALPIFDEHDKQSTR